MAAPTIGSGYMAISAPITSGSNPAEDVSKLDPNFASAWTATKNSLPDAWGGDTGLIAALATLAYRYKAGAGPYTPTLSSISPTTIVRNTAFNLTCTGTLFDPGARVEITLAGKTTVLAPSTSSTATQIIVAVPGANVLGAAGTATVLVRNLNGTASATQNLTVT